MKIYNATLTEIYELKQNIINKLIHGDVILDVGCAEFPNYLLRRGRKYGIDIQKIKNLGNYKEFKQVNLNFENIPYEDKFFDTVILGEVIEHVENPSHLLREANRILKDNGQIIITTPHASYYWDIIRNWFFSFVPSMDEGEHLSNWNILDLQRLLKRNGFKIKRMYGNIMQINLYFFRLNIPVKWFPKLGFIITYDCVKIGKPKNTIATRSSLGYNIISNKIIEVENIPMIQ